MKLYQVTATITIYHEGWTSNHGIPTFYLNADVQGILSESGARKVAFDIIGAGRNKGEWDGDITIREVEREEYE